MSAKTGSRAPAAARLAVLAVLAAAAAAALKADPRRLAETALAAVESAGPWGPVLFGLLYVAAAVVLFPGSWLTLGAGFLFGPVQGTVVVSLASTAGAAAAFLVGRHLARGWVVERFASDPRFAALDEAVGREGRRIVFLTRLSPLFPYNLLNYALGLTRVGLADFVLASWAGMLPATVVYVYLGSLAAEVARLGAPAGQRSPAQWALSVLGLAATAGVAWYAARLGREALRKAGAERGGGS